MPSRSSRRRILPTLLFGRLLRNSDHARTLVAGQPLLAVRHDIGLGRALIAAHDKELHRLARVLVLHADRGDFEHAQQHRDHIFDSVRVHVEVRHENRVLLAIDDLHIAARIEHADIARTEKTVRRHDLSGFVGAVPVTHHHLRPANADLAGLAERDFVVVVIADGDFGRGQRQADRAGVLGRGHRIARHAGRCFRQVRVAFDDRHARHREPAFGDGFLHGHAAAVRRDELRKIQLAEIRMIQERVIRVCSPPGTC